VYNRQRCDIMYLTSSQHYSTASGVPTADYINERKVFQLLPLAGSTWVAVSQVQAVVISQQVAIHLLVVASPQRLAQ